VGVHLGGSVNSYPLEEKKTSLNHILSNGVADMCILIHKSYGKCGYSETVWT